MSVFKNILDIAYECGLAGNSYNETVIFLQNSSYSNHLNSSDFEFTGLIYENYTAGHLDFVNELVHYNGEI